MAIQVQLFWMEKVEDLDDSLLCIYESVEDAYAAKEDMRNQEIKQCTVKKKNEVKTVQKIMFSL